MSEANEVNDPFTSFAYGAVQHHEMYSAWMDAGFTADQAMELLTFFLSEILRQGNDEC